MTVILLGEEGASESDHGGVVREDPDHVGAAADFLVDALEWVRGPQLRPVFSRERVEREQLFLGFFQQPGDLRRGHSESVDHVGEPLPGFLAGVGVEDLADGGGDHWLLGAAAVAEHVAEEVHVMPTSA
jgi:hypothetical protein